MQPERDTDAIPKIMLESITAEIESFVGLSGWDQPPTLFALVPTRVLAADPGAAEVLSSSGLPLDPDRISPNAITPIAQDELPEGPLDEALAQIGWPEEVIGCALSQEILMLPPSVEAELAETDAAPVLQTISEHPLRREARLVAVVLRDGPVATILRLRGAEGIADDLLTGEDLAPNLVAALRATLEDADGP